jgi:signal transduction histidine kinase/tetratricopeptide (TPR) repeat protein
MIKRRYILFLLLIIPVFLSPDTAAYSQTEPPATKQIDSLIQKSKELIYKNIDSSFYLGRLALKLSEKVNYYKGLEKAYHRIGTDFLIEQQNDSAKIYLNRAVHFAKMINDYGSLADSYNNLGYVYDELTQYDSAMAFYDKALYYYKQVDDSSGIGTYYLNMGIIYDKLRDFLKSYQYLIKSEIIAEQTRDSNLLAYVYSNMGDNFREGEKYEKAKKYYIKAINLFKKSGDLLAVAATEQMFSQLYCSNHLYLDALNHINNSIKTYEKVKNEEGKLSSTINKIKILILLKKYSRARETINLVKVNPHLTIEQKQWVLYYSAMISFEKGKYNIAKKKIKRSLKLNAHFKDTDLGKRTYQLLYLVAKKQNQLKEGLKYYIKYKYYFDAVQTKSLVKRMTNYQKLRELAYKELEIKKLKNEDKIQELQLEKQEVINKAFYIGSLILITILLIILYQLDKIRKLNQSLKKMNEERENFYRIFSHDVKNSLGAVLSYSELLTTMQDEMTKEEVAEIVKSINKGATAAHNLLRNLLEWLIAKKEGREYVKERLNLRELVEEGISSMRSSMRHKEITCDIDVDENLFVEADRNSIVSVIRNLCSNAVKFSHENGKIKVYVNSASNSFVEVTVEDYGVGIPSDKLPSIFSETKATSTMGTQNEKGTGLGLPLVKTFVEKNGGKITVESTLGKGSKFTFTIPRI